jgi:hypothetical protein
MPYDILEDGNFVLAQVNGPYRLSAPIPDINANYLLEQDMMQNDINYVPLPLNTNHPTLPLYKLVSEDQPTTTGGVRQWTRTYARVPAQWTDTATLEYLFIGWGGTFVSDGRFPGGIDPTSVQGRERFTKSVNAKIVYDYFLVGIGGSYLTKQLIPVTQKTRYYYNVGGIFPAGKVDVNYIWDITGSFGTASTPSLTDYFDLCNTDAAATDSFSLVAESSRVTRWKGNIFQRETIYVKAE